MVIDLRQMTSYATYDNAMSKLRHVLGDRLDDVHMHTYRAFVMARGDGRFVPTVLIGTSVISEGAAIARRGILVLN